MAGACCCCRRRPMTARARLKERLDAHFGVDIGVIISDSVGRAWRLGTVGLAIGAAGVPSLWDRRGEKDLSGRPLEVTEVGVCRCGGRHRRARHGRGGGGPPGRPRARARLERGRRGRRRRWCGPRPRTCSDEPARPRPTWRCRAASAAPSCRSGWRSLLGERLSIIVNTGDDFEHLGLHISPDVDTALYTLAGLVNEETGWGRRDETWTFMSALGRLGGPDLVQARRRRSCHPRRSHRAARRRRDADRKSARTWRRSWASARACCP